ncbi:hypothetical protein PIB30_029383 [Stylosanthes scabra]|uniref:Methyltransferase n=1 Tax=Stylosanthes scabra TaxID=79078 RepID=A0ABU6TBI2_9FABA|nr:hypothetical protein [Stylosanthes scabra]
MAKDYNGSPKHHGPLDAKRNRITWILGVSGLCILSYIMGSWKSTPTPTSGQYDTVSKVGCEGGSSLSSKASPFSSSNLDFESHHQLDLNGSSGLQEFPPCDMKYSEYTPCQDQVRGRRYDRNMLKYRERHCPAKDELLYCLIPAPPNYKAPFRWPQSRDYAWYDNIPHKELSIEKAIQNWIQVEGDRFRFPGGGTMFPRGADAYIDDLNQLIPLRTGSIRTAIDTGCGVASFGAYLLKRDVIAMSFAPRDTHEAQVQFALERGVPAMIGIMGSLRLPYPARAFDMAHCSRCLIPWGKYDGLYLIEVDRILRPGGYWVLSGPPIHWKRYWRGWQRTQEDLQKEQDEIERVAAKVTRSDKVAGGELEKWPKRAFTLPPRISSGSIPGITAEKFKADNDMWRDRMVHYKRIAPLSQGKFRNVMDMNAYLGGFAAAMLKYPVWVMNVVPPNSDHDTLGAIFERGLIGTYHDWCEAFSTYPRTYDMIHAGGIFNIYQDRCNVTLILLEMDRILRPEGTVIFREGVELLVKIKSITDAMRWKSSITDHESGPFNPEKILVAEKTYWTGEANQSQN